MCNLIMSNGLCACGLPPQPKHEHREAYKAGLGRYCIDCGKVLIDPILDFSDPRLPKRKPKRVPTAVELAIAEIRRLPTMPLDFTLIELVEIGGGTLPDYIQKLADTYRDSMPPHVLDPDNETAVWL